MDSSDVAVMIVSITIGMFFITVFAGAQDKADATDAAPALTPEQITEQAQAKTTMKWFYGLSEVGTVVFRSSVDGEVGTVDGVATFKDFEGNVQFWNGKYLVSTKTFNIGAPLIEVQSVTEAENYTGDKR